MKEHRRRDICNEGAKHLTDSFTPISQDGVPTYYSAKTASSGAVAPIRAEMSLDMACCNFAA